MLPRQLKITNIILGIMALVLTLQLFIDAGATGDFLGYVNAGNLVLRGEIIYHDILNTWPPFFSIFSVPIALLDHVSSYGVRWLWLAGSLAAAFHIMKLLPLLFFNQPVALRKEDRGIHIQDPIVFVPLLIMMRFIMDNMSNIQINIFMLWSMLIGIQLFMRKQYMAVGFILGLTISLKVYTIFFLFYFLFKREYKVVAWTIVFVVLINAICLWVFGYEMTYGYFKYWIKHVSARSFVANHNNQSLFGAFLRFFTTEDTTNGMWVNWMDLPAKLVKKLTYLVVVIAAIVPAFYLRKKLDRPNSAKSLAEYSLLFTLLPILSPVAWKAYFIFLWVPYFMLYYLLFKTANYWSARSLKFMRRIFWLTVVLTVGTTEMFLGPYLSDVAETYSLITLGSILLLGLQFYVVLHFDKFDLSSVSFSSLPSPESAGK